jgi:cytosine/adenosine deaminase-related metal-dependent hydrolase
MRRASLLGLVVSSFAASQTTTLVDCAVLDARSGVLQAQRSIVMRGDRITAVAPATARIPEGSRQVPCSGKFAIPGLWDMHVHVGQIEENWFPLYLANGVTGLREMAASDVNARAQHRYQGDLTRGRRNGPELISTLFPMDAPAIANAAQARAEVARRAALGLTYIKVYNGLSREAYFAIADECRRRRLQMVGHVPDRVSAHEAARAGQASIEHLDGVLLACSSKEAQCRRLVQANRYPWKALLDTFDSAKANSLIEMFRETGVWQTPTLMLYHVANLARERRLPVDIPIEYARRDYLQAWPREAMESPFSGIDGEDSRRLLRVYSDLVRRMQQRGVRILAGTDTPNPYCIPGFALHRELALLVEAGLTPADALRAATCNPAAFLGLTKDFGSIEAGKVADIVLLDANPLESIANTKRIHAVVRRGRVTEAAGLRAMLDGVREAVNAAQVDHD